LAGVYRGSAPKFQRPRQPRSALSVLKRYSLQYFPVSCESWASSDACGADFDIGGPWVEQTASDNCVVGDILRRKSAYSVVGDGRCSDACNSVAFRSASSSAGWLPSLCAAVAERDPPLNPGILTPSRREPHPHVRIGASGACTCR
jgi:hypothetical protein